MASIDDVPALVRQLGGRRIADRERAAEQLLLLSSRYTSAAELSEIGSAVTAAGAVPLLVQRLRSGRSETQMQAARVLLPAATDDSGKEAIAAAGGLQALVQLLSSPEAILLDIATSSILQLVLFSPQRSQQLAEAGGVSQLVHMLQHRRVVGTALAQRVVGTTLQMLGHVCTWHPPSCRTVAQDAGIVRVLLQLLQPSANSDAERAAAAADLLGLLAYDSPDTCSAILAAGGAPVLEAVLRDSHGDTTGNAEKHKRAAFALCCLARTQPSLLQTAAAAGAIPALIESLEDAVPEAACMYSNPEVSTAAWALGALAQPGAPHRQACEAAVPALQQLLLGGPANDDVRSQIEAALHILTAELQQLQSTPAGEGAAAVPAARPAAALPRAPRICAGPGCGATHGLRRCGGCGTVRYCGEPCRNAHWRSHKAECRRIQAEQAAARDAAAGEAGEARECTGAQAQPSLSHEHRSA